MRDAVGEVRARVLDQYLPAWCESSDRPEPLDPSEFVGDWGFLTPGIAHWFLLAVDEGVVEVTEGGDLRRGDSYPDGIFEQHGRKDLVPRPMKVRRESFFEVAAVAMLAIRYGWPVERLTFQPKGWSLDFLAYADDAWSEVGIGGEAKRLQREATSLWASLQVCGERGDHAEAECTEGKNHHRKYLGILKFRPRIVWIVGPKVFDADPDLVFRTEEGSGGIVRLHRTDASVLMFSSD